MEVLSPQPLVSIIVPVYNTEPYLRACLESVAAQTYKNFECLIVIDGSPDSSILIAKDFARRDGRFTILEKINGGLSSARNYGMDRSVGIYLSFLDSDDYWKKDKLKRQVEAFNQYPAADIVYSHCEIDESGSIYEYKGQPYSGNPLDLLHSNSVIGSGSSVMMRQTVFRNLGGFNESLKSFEDLEYWFRAAISDFKFTYIPHRDVVITRRGGSLSKNDAGMISANIKALNIQLSHLSTSRYRSSAQITTSVFKRLYFTEVKLISKKQIYLSIAFLFKLAAVYLLYELRRLINAVTS